MSADTHLLSQLGTSLRTLNLFKKASSRDDHRIRNQIISTRVYLILLYTALGVFSLYITLAEEKETISIPIPSMDTYKHLQSFDFPSLVCPCSQISLKYDTFIRLQPTYHPVCSSDFVSPHWITFLSDLNRTVGFTFVDFRLLGPLQFSLLRQLCSLATHTVDDALRAFYSRQLVTGAVRTNDQFDAQAHLLADQFIASTTDTFVLSLDFIRSTTQGNQLVSGLFTNYYVHAKRVPNGPFIASIYPSGYAQKDTQGVSKYCYCSLQTDCSQEAGIYDTIEYELNFTVNGMRTGCYVFESLLLSTLECLYDQACLDALQSIIIPLDSTHHFTALNSSNVSAPNTTVESILKQLMVEKWHTEVSFNNYYNACHPVSCTYSTMTHRSIIYVLVSILALCDGLTQVLRIMVPLMVKCIRRRRDGQRQTCVAFVYSCRTLLFS